MTPGEIGQILSAIGRLEGRLEEALKIPVGLSTRLDSHDSRLNDIEISQAKAGRVTLRDAIPVIAVLISLAGFVLAAR